jgi:hypothetical protein
MTPPIDAHSLLTDALHLLGVVHLSRRQFDRTFALLDKPVTLPRVLCGCEIFGPRCTATV